ncbi:MAG: acyltransferase family protein [Steroidobacteraceae bacterium]
MNEQTQDRLHGLDAVRSLALMGGVVLHAAMAFLPGTQLWVVVDTSRSTTLSVAFFVIHMARMTVFFVLAGYFGRLVLHRVGVVGFVRNRALRIAVPLLLAWPLVYGAILVVMGAASPGGGRTIPLITAATFPLTHLWFLYLLLWLYAGVLLLRGAIALVDRGGRFRGAIGASMRMLIKPWAPMVLAAPVVWVLYRQPYWFMWFGVPTPDTGLLPNRVALLTYGLALGVGWLLQRASDDLLARLQSWWGLYLGLALASTIGCLATTSLTPLLAPAPFGAAKLRFAAMYAVGIWSWTLALIGMGLRFLNAPSPRRRYLADASYWVYLAHLPLVMALQLVIRDWPLPWPIKFALLAGTTMTLLLLSYHWLVRPTWVGALLNGRRHPRIRPTSPTPGTLP